MNRIMRRWVKAGALIFVATLVVAACEGPAGPTWKRLAPAGSSRQRTGPAGAERSGLCRPHGRNSRSSRSGSAPTGPAGTCDGADGVSIAACWSSAMLPLNESRRSLRPHPGYAKSIDLLIFLLVDNADDIPFPLTRIGQMQCMAVRRRTRNVPIRSDPYMAFQAADSGNL